MTFMIVQTLFVIYEKIALFLICGAVHSLFWDMSVSLVSNCVCRVRSMPPISMVAQPLLRPRFDSLFVSPGWVLSHMRRLPVSCCSCSRIQICGLQLTCLTAGLCFASSSQRPTQAPPTSSFQPKFVLL
jgi:hypothetical protein